MDPLFQGDLDDKRRRVDDVTLPVLVQAFIDFVHQYKRDQTELMSWRKTRDEKLDATITSLELKVKQANDFENSIVMGTRFARSMFIALGILGTFLITLWKLRHAIRAFFVEVP